MSLNKLSMLIVSERVFHLLKVLVALMVWYPNTFHSLHQWTLALLTSLLNQAHQVAAFQCNHLPELPLVDLLVEW